MVLPTEVERSDTLAVALSARYHDTARDEVVGVLARAKTIVLERAEQAEGVHVLLIGENADGVAVAEGGLFIDEFVGAVGANNAADDHLADGAETAQVVDGHERQLGGAKRDVHADGLLGALPTLRFQSGLLLRKAHAEEQTDEFHREDCTHDRQRISHGITRCHRGRYAAYHILTRLLHSRQRGCARHSTREHTIQRVHTNTRGVMQPYRAEAAEQDDGGRQEVQLQTAALERREGRTNLQTNAIHK